MSNTLIQNRIITVPATTGTNIYKTQFDSDKNFNFVDGIACYIISGDTSQNIEIEFKDDNETIFNFTPVANWVKDSTAQNKDLTEVFRAVSIVSKGRNIYCNVKATDTTEPVKFVVMYRQTNDEPRVKNYDFQSYEVEFSSFPAFKNITLPSKFKNVVGVAAASTSNEAEKVLVRIENTQKNLVDPVQLSTLNVTKETLYDQSFFPVSFACDGQELKLYCEAVDTVTGPVTAKVYFLLTD